jgi:hypothetical protein
MYGTFDNPDLTIAVVAKSEAPAPIGVNITMNVDPDTFCQVATVHFDDFDAFQDYVDVLWKGCESVGLIPEGIHRTYPVEEKDRGKEHGELMGESKPFDIKVPLSQEVKSFDEEFSDPAEAAASAPVVAEETADDDPVLVHVDEVDSFNDGWVSVAKSGLVVKSNILADF